VGLYPDDGDGGDVLLAEGGEDSGEDHGEEGFGERREEE